jgi:crotonobetainyl-CoA:carnitine CoA-transferase CaiB-like acyl-CoA transferase
MTGLLASLRVLDFTTLLPGPFATMMLADLGADVLRVEAPNRPDLVRSMPPFDGEISAWHGVLNRSKRSLALDLKKPGAPDIVKRLISDGGYDIVIEQFRPGVMDRLGIGYESLQTVNPALIYCAITGYGQSGPLRDRAGHDINYLSRSGVMSHSGRLEGGPTPLGVQLADVGGGSLGALVGLLTAVIHRHESGEGQLVDISMIDMMLAWQTHIFSQYLIGKEEPTREASLLNGGSYYDFYETADGRYLSVGSLEPKFWVAFCEALGRPDLISKAYDLDPAVKRSLKAELRDTIVARPMVEWTKVFATLDACVEPVLKVTEVISQPQTEARNMVVKVPKADGSEQQQVGSPFHFSHGRANYKHPGVKLGTHSNEVLAEVGYKSGEIEFFRQSGLLG